jgi:hypothetical protein
VDDTSAQQVSRHARADRRNLSAQHCRAGQAVRAAGQAGVSTAHGYAGGLHQQAGCGAFRAKLNDVETRSTATFRCWSSTTTTTRARRALRRRRARHGHSARDSTMLFASRGHGAVLLRRRDRHEDHAAHAQGRREGPVGLTGWPKDKGRDGERTPMQWDASANAGFTRPATPWLPVPPSAAHPEG